MKTTAFNRPQTPTSSQTRRYTTRLILTIALSGIALFTSNAAHAQGRVVKAVIPFSFAVDGQMLPAGTYIITPPLLGSVTIRSVDKRSPASTVTFQADRPLAAGGKLTFEKYGDHYFLHPALCPSEGDDLDIFPVNLAKARPQENRPWAGETVFVATIRMATR